MAESQPMIVEGKEATGTDVCGKYPFFTTPKTWTFPNLEITDLEYMIQEAEHPDAIMTMLPTMEPATLCQIMDRLLNTMTIAYCEMDIPVIMSEMGATSQQTIILELANIFLQRWVPAMTCHLHIQHRPSRGNLAGLRKLLQLVYNAPSGQSPDKLIGSIATSTQVAYKWYQVSKI